MFIYFAAGADCLPAQEARAYLVKALIMALLLPSVIFYYAVHCCRLEKELEECDALLSFYEEQILNYKSQLDSLKHEYQTLTEQYETTIAKADSVPHKKVTDIRRKIPSLQEALSRREKLLLPLLFCAYTGNESLSQKEKENLIQYLKEL